MILSITLSLLYSCSTPYIITNERKSIGRNLITKADIQADLSYFEDRIDNFYVDTTTNSLTVQIRGVSSNKRWLDNKGHIVLFNLNNDSAKWSMNINYQTSTIYQKNNMIIQTKGNTSSCLFYRTGGNKWSINNQLIFTDFKRKIGFGFIQNGKNRDIIGGVDLNNGKPLWERVIDSDYGWNDITPLNDSVRIVVAEGLHSINLKTGGGWDFKALTGKKDYAGTIAMNAAGVAVGMFTGAFIYTTGYDLYHGIVSNTWIDSTSIYWAAKQKIVKLNHEGQIQWEYDFPIDKASKSDIFLIDSLVYMVNFGYAYYNNKFTDFGHPFVAAFNQNSGQKVFLSELNDNKSTINDYYIKNQDLLTISNTRISKYSLTDGSLEQEKIIDTDSLGYLKRFVTKHLYIKQDSTFKTLEEIDSLNLYLLTKKDKIIAINDKFEVVKQLDDFIPYITYLVKDGYKFIGSLNESYILDKNGKVVANISVSRNAVFIGSKLYDCKENAMVIVDLKDILLK